MTAQPANFSAFIDAARDSVAREIATLRQGAVSERELREAHFRAKMAELDVRIAAVAEVERRLDDRLATLKDGEPGRDGKDGVDGTAGRDGADGVPGKDGEPGRDGTPGERGDAGLPGKDAEPVSSEHIAAAVAAYLTENPPKQGEPGKDGRDGIDGQDGVSGEKGDAGEAGQPGRDGVDGKDGERGPEGPTGKLPVVGEWTDRVHYEGEVCTFAGAAYQAMRDTGKEPGHDDWLCIIRAGRDGQDGRSFNVRGTWLEAETYSRMDVVALNGASFAAKRDEPGPCPGEGWQLIAAQGKQGKPGERSTVRGDRGMPGPAVHRVSIDGEGMLTLFNADGTTVQCDLYPVLTRAGL